MKKFQFIGALTTTANLRLTKLGEEFEADPDDVFCSGGITAIPEEDFADIFEDVPPEMLKQYEHAETRRDPPKILADALQLAAMRLHELRGGK